MGFFMRFGESSIDLELRLWINEPACGVVRVRNASLLGMWDRFEEQEVQISPPQRDPHIKNGNVVVILDSPRGGAAV